jgi:hypothetical protein
MWDDPGEHWPAVMHSAPLGADGLSKWNQHWYHPTVPHTGFWLQPSDCGSSVPELAKYGAFVL